MKVIQHLNADKLLDTVRYYKLKNGSVVASKVVLEYNDKQMKALVKSSNKTVQQIAKKFNKIETVVKSITETKIDYFGLFEETFINLITLI